MDQKISEGGTSLDSSNISIHIRHKSVGATLLLEGFVAKDVCGWGKEAPQVAGVGVCMAA